MRLTLRVKLTLFAALIAILPLAVSGQSLIRIAQDEMKSSVNSELATVAAQIVAEVDATVRRDWLQPLLLLRSALDQEGIGVREKISLLTNGVAQAPDVAAVQLTIDGARTPLVVSQDSFVQDLSQAFVNPIDILRVNEEELARLRQLGEGGIGEVERVPETDYWMATLYFPLETPIAGRKAEMTAKVLLTRLTDFIETHPFQATGLVRIVDANGQQVFAAEPTDLSHLPTGAEAVRLIPSKPGIVSVQPYLLPDGESTLAAMSFPAAFDWAVMVEKAEADAYYTVQVMFTSLGVWLAVGVGAAVLAAILFAARIARPILAIGSAANEVAEGDLQVRVKGTDAGDEIGELARRFNHMIGQLHERFELQKFVSTGTMTAIQKSEDGVHLGGERRTVAIMFADIRGYTEFAENRDPETVVTVLNRYLQRQADLVASFSGDIDKYVGDQIMAVFQGPDMALNAARCALAIQEITDELNREAPDENLGMGIGLDMGEVVMGAMGSTDRMDYTVLGDHVNTAARLCSAAPAGEVLATAAMAGSFTEDPGFAINPKKPLKVKGKADRIEVVGLVRAPDSDRPEHDLTGQEAS